MKNTSLLKAAAVAGACIAAGIGMARADTTYVYEYSSPLPTYVAPATADSGYSYSVPSDAYGSPAYVYGTPDPALPPTAILGGPAANDDGYTNPDGSTTYSYTNPDGSVTSVTTQPWHPYDNW